MGTDAFVHHVRIHFMLDSLASASKWLLAKSIDDENLSVLLQLVLFKCLLYRQLNTSAGVDPECSDILEEDTAHVLPGSFRVRLYSVRHFFKGYRPFEPSPDHRGRFPGCHWSFSGTSMVWLGLLRLPGDLYLFSICLQLSREV